MLNGCMFYLCQEVDTDIHLLSSDNEVFAFPSTLGTESMYVFDFLLQDPESGTEEYPIPVEIPGDTLYLLSLLYEGEQLDKPLTTKIMGDLYRATHYLRIEKSASSWASKIGELVDVPPVRSREELLQRLVLNGFGNFSKEELDRILIHLPHTVISCNRTGMFVSKKSPSRPWRRSSRCCV